MENSPVTKRIPGNKLKKIVGDARETARAAKLVYVNDRQEGIRRLKKGKGFRYVFKDRPLKDKEQLARIRSLVLPPAWKDVWICAKENGHLQATGIDARGRKQYRYHPLWNQLRNQTKFYRMIDFGKALPQIRKAIKKDLARPGLVKEKVLATIVALMERTSIRIGNEEYEKANGSIGLTTMKNKHVEVKGRSLKFSFIGKKGKEHLISIKSKRLSRIVRHCRELPGKELFQYYDEEGVRQPVDSGMVNEYIREISGCEFTAKDFRTWAGTVQCLLALKECGMAETQAEAKKIMTEVLDKVALHLGNTRTVCKKYYVHPCIGELYESQKLQTYLDKLEIRERKSGFTGLTNEEKLVVDILKKAA